MDEGYIKFNCNWIKSKPLVSPGIKRLCDVRDSLYILGLIGAYADGVGFGNLSIRNSDNEFLITGSKTGNLKKIDENHITKVVRYDLNTNTLSCAGPIIASSESFTHAAVYEASRDIHAVIHVHSKKLWDKLINNIPTTRKEITYGTPEMAKEVLRLYKETDLKDKKIFVMGGHEEGIVAFGKDLKEAEKIILEHLN
jgi:ribulose-5-phosphate 4-epimerase/fuculose-1-phosphate aldolase